jgi:NAD(P)-dependent dehydrogenase (short-subunit alcohol dehydrogenase family)
MLTDKVVLITGAGRGIGAAAAKLFATQGARVMLAARTESELSATVAEIRAAGGTAEYVLTDVTKPASIENAVQTTVSTFGRLDLAFNNGGASIPQVPIAQTEEEHFDLVTATNFKGVYFSIASEVRAMIETGGGAIVNTSSMGSLGGSANLAAYSAAKRAVNSLTETAAVEYGPKGIRVNAVAPGITLTASVEAWAEQNPAVVKHINSITPLGKAGTPEDVAQAAAWLLSDQAAHITGIIVPVDGGMRA